MKKFKHCKNMQKFISSKLAAQDLYHVYGGVAPHPTKGTKTISLDGCTEPLTSSPQPDDIYASTIVIKIR